MKALNPSTGNLEEVYVKALDSMPVGAEIDFTGSASDIPTGWEEVSEWKELATDVAYNQQTNLPSDFNEIIVDIFRFQHFNFHILKNQLSQSNTEFRSGYYYSSSSNVFVRVQLNEEKINVIEVAANGSDVSSTAVYSVYYK